MSNLDELNRELHALPVLGEAVEESTRMRDIAAALLPEADRNMPEALCEKLAAAYSDYLEARGIAEPNSAQTREFFQTDETARLLIGLMTQQAKGEPGQ